MAKKHDSSKVARHRRIEEAMHDVIKQHHPDHPIGHVDNDEVAALQRYIGVKTNMEGEPVKVGELITAAGIVMEETGAKPEVRRPNPNYRNKPDRPVGRRSRSSGKSFFFMGGSGGK